jgi:hypothetical protein
MEYKNNSRAMVLSAGFCNKRQDLWTNMPPKVKATTAFEPVSID